MPQAKSDQPVQQLRSRKSLPIKNNRPHKKARCTDTLNFDPSDKENFPLPKAGSKRKSTSDITIGPGWIRNYHKDFDPTIEIRRAKERYELYKQKDWFNLSILCDEERKDLSNYEKKLQRKEKSDENTEKKVDELRRRQKDIDLSKISDIYAKYIFEIPKPVREQYHPKTPNKFLKMSRRAWDGQVKRWRRHLHNYMDKDFSQGLSSRSSISGTSTEFSFSISDELSECKDDLVDNCSEFVFESVPVVEEDEDTLQGGTKIDSLKTLPQDSLHSGLSNDMKYVDFHNEDTICSPFKRKKE